MRRTRITETSHPENAFGGTMRLFAIADLHLPGGQTKPMDVFGAHWERHFERISEDWRQRVAPEDTVLIPGDISWAMQLRDAVPDLQAIGALPGRKVLIRGNHDYWWGAISRVREALPEGMEALQQSAVDLGPCVVCGTRGWTIPTADTALSAEDQKIYLREIQRLSMALDAANRMAAGRPVVVMLHYPPLYDLERASGFTALMEAAGVHTCVYGHLHGPAVRAGFNGAQGGVRYLLTSCDSLSFRLREIDLDAPSGAEQEGEDPSPDGAQRAEN